MKPQITVTIDRGNIEDWLSEGDPMPTPEQTQRWVDQYADALQAEMTRLNPGADVSVEWGSGMMSHKISIENVAESVVLDLLESLELDYDAACYGLTDFTWMTQ